MELNKETGLMEVHKKEVTPEEWEMLKNIQKLINGINLCKTSDCKNERAHGSSRCQQCSDKYKKACQQNP